MEMKFDTNQTTHTKLKSIQAFPGNIESTYAMTQVSHNMFS